MTIETTKTAGDDVESRCLKCKAVTNHTIIAMTDDTIAKVQCNSCDARHNYRAPVPEKKKTSSTRRRRDGILTVSKTGTSKAKTGASTYKKTSIKAVNFEALIQNKDLTTAIPYAIDATLTAGDLVNHSIFGLGVVTEIQPVNKAYVTFQEHGTKLMACKLG